MQAMSETWAAADGTVHVLPQAGRGTDDQLGRMRFERVNNSQSTNLSANGVAN